LQESCSTPHHTHTTPTTPHHAAAVPAKPLAVVIPLHSIGDLLKTFKRMLQHTNNLELTSTMLSFAPAKDQADQRTFTLPRNTCMAYWRDPVTGMGASGCSNPFLKK
jgi:hypothetical protein